MCTSRSRFRVAALRSCQPLASRWCPGPVQLRPRAVSGEQAVSQQRLIVAISAVGRPLSCVTGRAGKRLNSLRHLAAGTSSDGLVPEVVQYLVAGSTARSGPSPSAAARPRYRHEYVARPDAPYADFDTPPSRSDRCRAVRGSTKFARHRRQRISIASAAASTGNCNDHACSSLSSSTHCQLHFRPRVVGSCIGTARAMAIIFREFGRLRNSFHQRCTWPTVEQKCGCTCAFSRCIGCRCLTRQLTPPIQMQVLGSVQLFALSNHRAERIHAPP